MTYDIETLMQGAIDFFTALFVTIPQKFIGATLATGPFRSIWVNFFGNTNVIKLSFVLAIIGGIYIFVIQNGFRSPASTSRNKRRM